jgi:peptidoglycan hydrolase-like protein with peptidoglycan-binding domain
MKRIIAVAAVLAAQIAAADTAIEQVQQALKQQGYYYGEVNGEKNADTTAAIRRFQIRNGLQVTGELNDETRHALDGASGSGSGMAASQTPVPRRKPDEAPLSPNTPRPAVPDQPTNLSPRLIASDLFRNTPYQTAPPELQRNVVLGAQTLLRRFGFYQGDLNGVAGTGFQFSLRAYQSRLGLPPDGRLDMQTLAALGLLPGQHRRSMAMPRQLPLPSQFAQPPVRGEWIPEYPEQPRDDDDRE